MNFEQFWTKALKHTEIHRSRVQLLHTGHDTHVPYIFLAESSINQGDTIVRKGEVCVKKPALFLPPDNPQFHGFEFEKENMKDQHFINFLLIRGISLPSLNYDNKTFSLDIYEGRLSEAIKHYSDTLQHSENVTTGLVTGPEDCWQFSLLIFICSQITKNAHHDVRKLLEDYKKKSKGDLYGNF